MKNELVSIFYACDDNFIKYTIVSIRSLIDNANKEREYLIHILNTGVSEDMRKATMALETENIKITFVDVQERLESISEKLPIRDYYSKSTYYRLFIAEMYPQYDKALYIDSDTVILGDICELYDVVMGNNYVAASRCQVIVQTNVYGEYVEKVMGIDRNSYFNAGVLLINCKAFRANNVLMKFVKLLNEYTFVVAQDQDYLNVLCHNKVLWMEPGWNTEVYGKLPVAENKIKLIHYIFASKPWHYEDCRLKSYFWNYAKKTSVYEQIVNELNNYTDEQKEGDVASVQRLAKTAVDEAQREDRFINRLYARWKDVKEARA